MPTTATTDFNLEFTEIAEEAWERAGKPLSSGYQLATARRSMNLLLIEWVNRGVNLWTLDEGFVPLASGVSEYTLPADTVDLLEHTLRRNNGDVATQNDKKLVRVGMSSYAAIPNKTQTGDPNQIFIRRERDAPVLVVWPVPSRDDYVISYWRMRRLQDAGDGLETPDLPFRFLPCLVAGLAYYLAMKTPELRKDSPQLKLDYEEQFKMAAAEDRERATMRLTPRIGRIGSR